MMSAKGLSSNLRRTLLLKVISKPQPTREDVASVIELTSSKVVDTLEAQSMTLYLVEGNEIAFRNVFYSPTLWLTAPDREKEFQEKKEKLLQLKPTVEYTQRYWGPIVLLVPLLAFLAIVG